jgi:rhodanese-related sulfurtransferase
MGKSVEDFANEAKREITLLSVDDVDARLGEALLLDVREPSEYAKGHLPGARLVPRGLLEIKADAAHPMRDPDLGDRARPVVTYCTGGIGVRSAMAARTLQEMGFANVGCLQGGLEAWTAADKPVDSG